MFQELLRPRRNIFRSAFSQLRTRIGRSASHSARGRPRPRRPWLHAALDGLVTWDTEALEAAVRTVADEAGEKPGDRASPLRAVLTGRRPLSAISGAQATPGTEGHLPRFADQMRTPA
ncbi:hypothetical protein [Sphingomonas sp.]|uniref:hypothetical protein n=1 Tax=Sphingomonas sp. TaxID=28214 RepID=UPI0028A7D606|nr:hypothetical protein [Sphingomonas sp.]